MPGSGVALFRWIFFVYFQWFVCAREWERMGGTDGRIEWEGGEDTEKGGIACPPPLTGSATCAMSVCTMAGPLPAQGRHGRCV